MVDEHTIKDAADALLQAAPAGSRVILFGSYAKGVAGPDSDLDFLVVEPQVQDRFNEMFRLRKALEPVLGGQILPVDVIVMRENRFRETKEVPNTLSNEVSLKGRVYERSAS